jgi:MFS family permease
MQSIRQFFIPSYQGNIPKFFIYRILYNFMLFMPVWVIFMQDKFGLSLTEVTLNDSAFWITMALTEVPTGAVADTWGRKQSQVIGMVIATGSILMFALAPVYPLVLLANSCWALGITFMSGADLALFYDTLRELGREEEYPKYRGRLQASVLVSIAVSSVLGGLIGEFNLGATFIITAGLMVFATGFLLLLKEPPREKDAESGETLSYINTLKVTFGAIKRQPGLLYALLFSNILPLVGGTIQMTFMQPYAMSIGLPIAALGVIALGLRASQFVGALSTSRFIDRFGEWGWLRIAPVVVVAGVLSLGLFESVAGIVLFALTGFANSVTRPLMERIILRQTPGSVRATILSVDSLFYWLLLALVGPMIGMVADRFDLQVAFTSVGIFFGLLLVGVLSLWERNRRLELASS